MGTRPILGVLPSLEAIRLPRGRLVLLGRFLSGMEAYREFWDGELRALVEPADASLLETNMDRTLGGDNVEVDPATLPFGLELTNYEGPELPDQLRACDVLLASVHHRQNHISQIARAVGTPVVYTSEYSLKTRLQIIRTEHKNPVVLAKRAAWELDQERRIRRALSMSDGLQANGVPTYEAYERLTPNSMLYFDGRMTAEMLVPAPALEQRLRHMLDGQPLRLTWSGRMNRMKGADQLVEVARHLDGMGVDFTLDIYGGGILEEPLRRAVDAEGLGDRVRLKGFVPFHELIPYTQRNYDVWLCCHPQGDPSGAYLETLGSGLPILGYANEALAGVLARVNSGRVVPVYHARALAELVRDMSRKRRQLAEWARTGLRFARNHTFDRSFRRRVEHFEEVVARHRQGGEPRRD